MANKPGITTMVYCHKKKKMVDKGTEWREAEVNAPMIIGPLKPFISPITKEEITSREQLRKHNKEHGVTNLADYSGGYIEERAKERIARMQGQNHEAKMERIEALKQAMRK